jgi:hypothetical protein
VALRALVSGALLFVAGCGATTVRLTAAPTVDTNGRPGFESTLSLGIGMPIDFHPGRSHHYLQTLTSIGGGLDGQTRSGMFTFNQSLDYVHWAEPRFDLRAGTHFVFQDVQSGNAMLQRYGFGAHAGLSPLVYANDTTWLVTHLGVGPQLRAEALLGPDGWLGRFSLPLAIELNFLAAGD